jgi:hypothetical protein
VALVAGAVALAAVAAAVDFLAAAVTSAAAAHPATGKLGSGQTACYGDWT